MSRKHKWVLLAMVAVPFIIAFGFRAIENHQFRARIKSRIGQKTQQIVPAYECLESLIKFGSGRIKQ